MMEDFVEDEETLKARQWNKRVTSVLSYIALSTVATLIDSIIYHFTLCANKHETLPMC